MNPSRSPQLRRHVAGRRRLLVALALAPLAPRAQDIEVVELRHRSAEDLLPVLRPLVEAGGGLGANGNRLLLRASPANRRQLRDMAHALDAPPRELAISVREDPPADGRRVSRAADGSLTIDSRGDAAGRSAAPNERVLSALPAERRIVVREGARAYVEIGAAIPMSFRHWVSTPQGLTEVRGITHYDAVTGFYARMLLAGDEVTIELTPAPSTVIAGAIDRAGLSTIVRGRLGEWIAAGGAELRERTAAAERQAGDQSALAAQRGVWLRVEPTGR